MINYDDDFKWSVEEHPNDNGKLYLFARASFGKCSPLGVEATVDDIAKVKKSLKHALMRRIYGAVAQPLTQLRDELRLNPANEDIANRLTEIMCQLFEPK